MDMTDSQDKIERYLLDQLSPQEEMEFKGALLNDAQLRREVHLTRLALRAVQMRQQPSTWWMRYRAAMVTAVILVIASIGFAVWMRLQTPDLPAAPPSAPQDSLPTETRIKIAPPTPTDAPIQPAPQTAAAPSPIASASDQTLSTYLQPGTWRSNTPVTSLNTPFTNYTTYRRDAQGHINLYWNGLITGTPKEKTTIEILLFPSDDQYLSEERPIWSEVQTVSTHDSVRINKWMNLAPGKYYLMVKDRSNQYPSIINANVFLVK